MRKFVYTVSSYNNKNSALFMAAEKHGLQKWYNIVNFFCALPGILVEKLTKSAQPLVEKHIFVRLYN